MIQNYICIVLAVALLAAFLLMLAHKWGFVEYVQVHGNEFFAKMFSCDFCLSWWCCVLVSTPLLEIGILQYLAIAIMATPITRKLL